MKISQPRIVIMPSQLDELRRAIDAENRASMTRISTWFARLAAGQNPLTGEPEPDPTDDFRADLNRFASAADEIIFGQHDEE